jgi:hypothetical protein
MLRILTAVFAIASGIIVLLGYFVPQLEFLRLMLVDWAIFIAAWAVLVGVVNLVVVQLEKFRTRQKGGIYGVLLVIALLGTFSAGLILGPEHPYMRLTVDAFIVPVEASLMAILAITLIYASIRLLRRRVDVMSILFLAAAIIFLIATIPMPNPLAGIMTPLQDAVLQGAGLVSHAGARGLLFGIALGTLLTGLRVLFGVDRPYGGK